VPLENPVKASRDGSGEEAVPSVTVQFSQLRPAVPMLRADGQLTLSTAPGLLPLLARTVGKRPWAVVLDLSGLTVLDVEVVAALVDVAVQAGEADIGLYVVAPDGIVPAALYAAGAPQLFDLHCDIESALKALA
jgi:anti-anti-sigma regulatory factor